MIWESPLSNKHGPLFADMCENLMEGHHGGPPRKLLTLLLYEAFSVTLHFIRETTHSNIVLIFFFEGGFLIFIVFH